MDELKTERTILRAFAIDDVDELLDVFRDAAVRRFLLDDMIVSEEWVRSEVSESVRRFAGSSAGLWAIRSSANSNIIGFAGFRPFFEPPELQLLYGLLPDYWGRGFATEAAGRVCDHVFEKLGFSEVVAAIDIPNDASAKVLERLGMSCIRTSLEGAAGTAFYRLDREGWIAGVSARHRRDTGP